MRILVIGSGGREHAVCATLQRTAVAAVQLFCAPGNAGIAQVAECVQVRPDDHGALLSFAAEKEIELTVVGPEAPLAAGLVDEFEQHGLKIVGPLTKAARLESSKAFAKAFMDRHSIPTPRFTTATSFDGE